MSNIQEKDIARQISIIEDGLEGSWKLLYNPKETEKYIVFLKPEVSGEWGKIYQQDLTEKEMYPPLEYKIIYRQEELAAYIIVRTEGTTNEILYRLDYLNSYQNIMYMRDPNGFDHHFQKAPSPAQLQ